MSDEEEIDDGGPAFPTEGIASLGSRYPVPGMSLRDWFAGQALAGFNCGDFPADDLCNDAANHEDRFCRRTLRITKPAQVILMKSKRTIAGFGASDCSPIIRQRS